MHFFFFFLLFAFRLYYYYLDCGSSTSFASSAVVTSTIDKLDYYVPCLRWEEGRQEEGGGGERKRRRTSWIGGGRGDRRRRERERERERDEIRRERKWEENRPLFWAHPGTRPITNWIEMRRSRRNTSGRSEMYGWVSDTYLNWLHYLVRSDERCNKTDSQWIDCAYGISWTIRIVRRRRCNPVDVPPPLPPPEAETCRVPEKNEQK